MTLRRNRTQSRSGAVPRSALCWAQRPGRLPCWGPHQTFSCFTGAAARSLRIPPSICHLAQGRRRETGTLWPEAPPAHPPPPFRAIVSAQPTGELGASLTLCSSGRGEIQEQGTGLMSALLLTGCAAGDKSLSCWSGSLPLKSEGVLEGQR